MSYIDVTKEVKSLTYNGTPLILGGSGSVLSHNIILNAGDWIAGDDGRFSQTVAVEDVTPDTPAIIVDVDLSTDDPDAKVAYLEAWGGPAANEVDQGEGTLTFYAWEAPTINIPVNVGVM